MAEITDIKKYLIRAKRDNLPVYPLDDEGTWKIVGGLTGEGSASGLLSGNRNKIKQDIVSGRYLDAIAYALKQEGFYGFYGADGNIEKVDAKKLAADKSLDALMLKHE